MISTPVSVVSGLAAAARRGILIEGGIYLEEARKIKATALDNTGTLTEGKPRRVTWSMVAPDGDAAAIEQIAVAVADTIKVVANGLRLLNKVDKR